MDQNEINDDEFDDVNSGDSSAAVGVGKRPMTLDEQIAAIERKRAANDQRLASLQAKKRAKRTSSMVWLGVLASNAAGSDARVRQWLSSLMEKAVEVEAAKKSSAKAHARMVEQRADLLKMWETADQVDAVSEVNKIRRAFKDEEAE